AGDGAALQLDALRTNRDAVRDDLCGVCRAGNCFFAGAWNAPLVGNTMNNLWQLENVGLGQRVCGVTLRIEPGVTAVLGHSGAGKTSLLNLLVGFEKP